MQEYSLLDDICWWIWSSLDGNMDEGKKKVYLYSSSLHQPVRKGSNFFFHFDIGTGHTEHHHLDAKEMQKKVISLKWRHTTIFSLLYIKGSAVILQNAWSQVWKQSSYILRGAWAQISFEGEKILLPSSLCQRRSQEVNQRTLETNLW